MSAPGEPVTGEDLSGPAPPDAAPPDPALDELATVLGVDLPPEPLAWALTHRSWAYENGGVPTNERMEFLGDAVLGLVVTEALYRTHPDLPEGRLAKLRASVVSTRALAEVARTVGLGAYLRLGRGEESTGGRDKSSILADAVEAVLGAVYLEAGLEPARALVHRLVGPALAQAATLGAGLDWKTSLQELAAERGLGVPAYEVTGTGPDHDRMFAARVHLVAGPAGGGEGRTKKEAEQAAAAAAVLALAPERLTGPEHALAGAGPPSGGAVVDEAGSGGTSPTSGS